MPKLIRTGVTAATGYLPEPGVYRATIFNAVEKVAQTGTTYFDLWLKLIDPPHPGYVFDKLYFTEKSMWKINAFLMARDGALPAEGEQVTLEAVDCVDAELTVKLSHRNKRDKDGTVTDELEAVVQYLP